MKIYDIVMIAAFALGCSTFSLEGETIRALITGGIAGVYAGWRIKK